jgi:hypothetical protein
MKYIKRRLLISVNGIDKIVSEDEFFRYPGLKVILGEPGAGKSSMVAGLLQNGAISCSPRILLAGAARTSFQLDRATIIDGVDEVTAYRSDGQGVISILAKIPPEFLPQCILTCRNADWDALVSEKDLQQMGCSPLIGVLVPFDDADIKAYIGLYRDVFDGKAFFKAAADAGAIELLRNPQMLVMFMLTAVNGNAFPRTRTDLYENASKNLVREDNEFHRSHNKNRKGLDELIRIASFICAQLVLGNQQGVDIDGAGDFGIASVDELASEEFGLDMVRAALATKLFKQSVALGVVEPCHRTVAEFLAAKFISQRLGESLSLRRLETLLYGPGFVVPAAFRGVHAWLATLHTDVTKEFIGRDPYGFLQYGDPQNISLDEVIFLIQCLEELIETAPFYRNDVLQEGFGRGVARLELKEWLSAIICDRERPKRLRILVLDCINGAPVIRFMVSELCAIVRDVYTDGEVRMVALEVLLAHTNLSVEWIALHSSLTDAADFRSAQLARDVVKAKVRLFSGQQVVDTILKYVQAGRSSEVVVATGGGFAKQMGDKAIADALVFLKTVQFVGDDDEDGLGGDLEKFRLEAIIEVAVRRIDLAPGIIWSELEFQSKSNRFLPAAFTLWYRSFDFVPATRLAIQEYVLYNPEKCPVHSPVEYLEYICPSLALTEDDAKHFLESLCSTRNKGENSERIWGDIAGYILSGTKFTDSVKEIVTTQAENDPTLKALLKQVTVRQTNVSQGRSQLESFMTNEVIRRHNKFQEARAGLISGKDFRTCLAIAQAYIGFPTPQEFAGGRNRVTELVGEQMLHDALNSFEAIVKRTNIAHVREITMSRTSDHPSIPWWHPVLIAYCVQAPDLVDIPKPLGKTALALPYWEEAEGLVPSTIDFYHKLRANVLIDDVSKRDFLRDFFEPFFENNCDWIPRLELLSDDDFFWDVAGPLAVEWLKDDSWSMRPTTILSLLRVAVDSVERKDIVDLVRKKTLDSVALDYTEQGVWAGMLFGLDYENNREFFSSFRSNGSATLRGFRQALSIIEEETDFTIEQNYVIITTFADDLASQSMNFLEVWDDDEPVLAHEFIYDHVAELALSSDSSVTALLVKFIADGLGNDEFQEDIKDLLEQNRRMRAERVMEGITLEKIRKILLSGRPSNASELQAIVMDELYSTQQLVKFDSVNRYQFFWESGQPKLENDCRDAIVTMLEPRLSKYGIRISTESRMPGDTRSDILLSVGEVNVSIEVKCQWHENLWVGAAGQLQDYTSDYRADGHGIYLVVFFGPVSSASREVKKSSTGKRAATGEELIRLLKDECGATVPSKTSIFVLDVSLPSEDRGSRNLRGKKSV